MRIVIAGAHGQIARRLGRLLSERGDTVVGLIRNPAHESDVVGDGVDAVVLDLESAAVEDVTAVVSGADAVAFAAGAGPGSGRARKDTVDRAAAVLLADAAERAGVRRYLLVSAMGVDAVADGATPENMDEVFLAYLRAKLAAEQDLLGRSGLATTVLRPGSLTDDPGTGRVTLARTSTAAACRGTTWPRYWSPCWTQARRRGPGTGWRRRRHHGGCQRAGLTERFGDTPVSPKALEARSWRQSTVRPASAATAVAHGSSPPTTGPSRHCGPLRCRPRTSPRHWESFASTGQGRRGPTPSSCSAEPEATPWGGTATWPV